MIRDGRRVEAGMALAADLAIIGAGAAGLTLALAVSRKLPRLKILVTEAGGKRFNFRDQSRYFAGEGTVHPHHPPIELYRRRMFGGTTSIWGGRCIPLSPDDLLPRPDLGRPGWPVSYHEVARFYPDALRILEAGECEFHSAKAFGNGQHDGDADKRAESLVLDQIERFSPPTDLGRRYEQELKASESVTVLLNTACTEILTDRTGNKGEGITLRAGGKSFTAMARTIVVAAGGLETPRLLLCSRQAKSCGLGNESDHLGRYYMTHYSGDLGRIRFSRPNAGGQVDYAMSRDGVWCRRLMLLDEATRRENGLPNFVLRPTIPAIHDPSHGSPVLSAAYFAKRFIVSEYARRLAAMPGTNDLQPGERWRGHAANVLTGLPELVRFTGKWIHKRVLPRRKLPSLFLTNGTGVYPLDFNAEQLPDPASRVTLGSGLDPNGMPCLKLDWCMAPEFPDQLLRTYKTMDGVIRKEGLGSIEVSGSERERVGDLCLSQGGHHMGTARMSGSDSEGVVDPDLQLWGTKGVYVLGSAVFPTCGFANPTLTIVALALRLAEHLESMSRHGKQDKRPEPKSVSRMREPAGVSDTA